MFNRYFKTSLGFVILIIGYYILSIYLDDMVIIAGVLLWQSADTVIEYISKLSTVTGEGLPPDWDFNITDVFQLPSVFVGTLSMISGVIGLLIIPDNSVRSSAILAFSTAAKAAFFILSPVILGLMLSIIFT